MRHFLILSLWTLVFADPGQAQLTGRIAFQSSHVDFNWDIWVLDAATGDLHNLTDSPGLDFDPSWSPDGSRLAFLSDRDGEDSFDFDIWVMDADGGNLLNLTADPLFETNPETEEPARHGSPTWSPDGRQIAFASNIGGVGDIWVMDADGGEPVNVTQLLTSDYQPSWSPDGRWIAFVSWDGVESHIWLISPDGLEVERLTFAGSSNSAPSWSPDGARIAFLSDRDGGQDIWVMDADGGGQTNLTFSDVGEGGPSWSPDGSHIVFSSIEESAADLSLYVIDAASGERRHLFDQPQSMAPSWWGLPTDSTTLIEALSWGRVKGRVGR